MARCVSSPLAMHVLDNLCTRYLSRGIKEDDRENGQSEITFKGTTPPSGPHRTRARPCALIRHSCHYDDDAVPGPPTTAPTSPPSKLRHPRRTEMCAPPAYSTASHSTTRASRRLSGPSASARKSRGIGCASGNVDTADGRTVAGRERRECICASSGCTARRPHAFVGWAVRRAAPVGPVSMRTHMRAGPGPRPLVARFIAAAAEVGGLAQTTHMSPYTPYASVHVQNGRSGVMRARDAVRVRFELHYMVDFPGFIDEQCRVTGLMAGSRTNFTFLHCTMER
ncbi:hypothetical protein EDB89DRAFT_1576703 [Lactarius sanguifluus]|nr:hypothetical protein EDB89DRAFT_1576703 [Lactarius sanguifluus]